MKRREFLKILGSTAASTAIPIVSNAVCPCFNIIQDMGNGQGALVLISPDKFGKVYMCKLPRA